DYATRCAAICLVAVMAGCGAPSAEVRSDAEKRAQVEAMCVEYHRSFPDVPEVSAEGLSRLLATGDVVLVDVRTEDERKVSGIPDAISKAAFEEDEDGYVDKTIVTYCTIGYRSGVYAEALREKGLDARNLRGSILSWVHDGKAVVDPEGAETKRVHVYGPEWDLLPEGYTAIW
ncbi:MAG: rhodanese-like domain-containing protein, partial [Candidatus Hydrogenedentes bacterium]|nr:rhodanese-like domain-containing protein [Candidatus Hydrogenedentota bacterium]